MQPKREQKENINAMLYLCSPPTLPMTMTAFTVLLPTPRPCVLPLPLFSGKVAAGFPSPADDYLEKT
jgi:DNA polymerase V